MNMGMMPSIRVGAAAGAGRGGPFHDPFDVFARSLATGPEEAVGWKIFSSNFLAEGAAAGIPRATTRRRFALRPRNRI